MKRTLAAVAAISLLLVGALPLTGNAAAKSKTTYALEGEARGLELSIAGQGVTLGFSAARVDSTPLAEGVAAGQCEIIGANPDPDSLPCNEATTESSSLGKKGDKAETCAAPAVPDPLGSILSIDIACGLSTSGIQSGKPFTTNEGKVAEVALEFDVGGVIPQLEDVKEQLIDALQDILDEAPDEIENALDQLTDSLDAGQAGQILVGPASTNVSSTSNGLTVESTGAGLKIGVVGIPDLDTDGIPIPGSSNALEDGLIIIEVGASSAERDDQRAERIGRRRSPVLCRNDQGPRHHAASADVSRDPGSSEPDGHDPRGHAGGIDHHRGRHDDRRQGRESDGCGRCGPAPPPERRSGRHYRRSRTRNRSDERGRGPAASPGAPTHRGLAGHRWDRPDGHRDRPDRSRPDPDRGTPRRSLTVRQLGPEGVA